MHMPKQDLLEDSDDLAALIREKGNTLKGSKTHGHASYRYTWVMRSSHPIQKQSFAVL